MSGIDEQSKTKSHAHISNVSNPLKVGSLTIEPIDKDGDFEMTMEHGTEFVDAYTYVSKEQALEIINFLQKGINGC